MFLNWPEAYCSAGLLHQAVCYLCYVITKYSSKTSINNYIAQNFLYCHEKWSKRTSN